MYNMVYKIQVEMGFELLKQLVFKRENKKIKINAPLCYYGLKL